MERINSLGQNHSAGKAALTWKRIDMKNKNINEVKKLKIVIIEEYSNVFNLQFFLL